MNGLLGLGGFVGPEFFFALSGFLIGSMLLKEVSGGSISLVGFYRRRWLRTIPAYLVFLLLHLLGSGENSAPLWRLWTYVVYAQSLIYPHPAFFPEAWSLAVEELFYLILPLSLLGLMRLARPQRAYLLAAILLICLPLTLRLVHAALVPSAWDAGVRKVSFLRLDAVGYGVLVAYFQQTRRWSNRRSVARVMCFAGIVLVVTSIVALMLSNIDSSYWAKTVCLALCPMGAALMLPRFVSIPAPKTEFLSLIVGHVAKVSYSMYLSNLLVAYFCRLPSVLPTSDAALGVVMFWSLTLVLSTLSYNYIERPFIRLYKPALYPPRGDVNKQSRSDREKGQPVHDVLPTAPR